MSTAQMGCLYIEKCSEGEAAHVSISRVYNAHYTPTLNLMILITCSYRPSCLQLHTLRAVPRSTLHVVAGCQGSAELS